MSEKTTDVVSRDESEMQRTVSKADGEISELPRVPLEETKRGLKSRHAQM